jgi:hypothetical protein
VQMKGLEGVKAKTVACGWRHSMVVDETGILFVCGWNKYGQLGLGDVETRPIPVVVTLPDKQPVRIIALPFVGEDDRLPLIDTVRNVRSTRFLNQAN